MNVSKLSLEESRRSIAQADSLGRVSFLAFIFIPLSLITSFFGMNIQEMTGSDATWCEFFIGAGSLCGLVALTCLLLWRALVLLLFAKVLRTLQLFCFMHFLMLVRQFFRVRTHFNVFNYKNYWRRQRIGIWLQYHPKTEDILEFMKKHKAGDTYHYFIERNGPIPEVDNSISDYIRWYMVRKWQERWNNRKQQQPREPPVESIA
jgi:hypothetical protein